MIVQTKARVDVTEFDTNEPVVIVTPGVTVRVTNTEVEFSGMPGSSTKYSIPVEELHDVLMAAFAHQRDVPTYPSVGAPGFRNGAFDTKDAR